MTFEAKFSIGQPVWRVTAGLSHSPLDFPDPESFEDYCPAHIFMEVSPFPSVINEIRFRQLRVEQRKHRVVVPSYSVNLPGSKQKPLQEILESESHLFATLGEATEFVDMHNKAERRRCLRASAQHRSYLKRKGEKHAIA